MKDPTQTLTAAFITVMDPGSGGPLRSKMVATKVSAPTRLTWRMSNVFCRPEWSWTLKFIPTTIFMRSRTSSSVMQRHTVKPQYGKFKIFLLLRFYVKSILEKLEVLKLPFLPFLGSEFCQFGKLQPSKSAKIPENQNSEPLNVLKWLILHF